jgi:hypothetical protein
LDAAGRALKARWQPLKRSLPSIELVRTKTLQRPFFTALHELLDQHPIIPMGTLLEKSGEQVWGLSVLLLAILTFIPGVANIVSLATLLVGVDMMRKSPYPWLPAPIRNMELHRGRIKELLARVEARLSWFAPSRGKRQVPSQRFLGFLVAWSALIAMLPIPLPFANMLPAASLILYGVALLEEWPILAWYGAALTFGTTVYFAFFLRQLLRVLKGTIHWLSMWFQGTFL